MSSIDYSLSSDFSGNIREDQLHSEIQSNTAILTPLDGIIRSGDLVTVRFFGNITENEGNVLNALVSVHIPDYTPVRRSKIVLPTTTSSITSNNWTRIGLGKFPGTSVIGDISYVDVSSYMESGLTQYQVRLIDRSNVDVICTANLNNTTLEPKSLGSILYQPDKESVLECLARTEGGTGQKIYIKNIDIWYGV